MVKTTQATKNDFTCWLGSPALVRTAVLCICRSAGAPAWLCHGCSVSFLWPYAWEAHHPQFPHPRLQPSAADAIVTSSIE